MPSTIVTWFPTKLERKNGREGQKNNEVKKMGTPRKGQLDGKVCWCYPSEGFLEAFLSLFNNQEGMVPQQ